MERILFFVLAALALTLSLAACKEVNNFNDPSPGGFTSQTAMGMYDANLNSPVAFDPNNHQMAFISTAIESRLQDNAPNVLMRCRLSVSPTALGQAVTVELSGKSVTTATYNTELVKKSGDFIWLWSTDSKVGFILFAPQP